MPIGFVRGATPPPGMPIALPQVDDDKSAAAVMETRGRRRAKDDIATGFDDREHRTRPGGDEMMAPAKQSAARRDKAITAPLTDKRGGLVPSALPLLDEREVLLMRLLGRLDLLTLTQISRLFIPPTPCVVSKNACTTCLMMI